MKKAWKYILSILIVIIIATAGTLYYFMNIKTYDIADDKIEEITESEYHIELPEDNGTVPVNNNGNEGTSNDSSDSTTTDSNEDETASTTTGQNNDGSTTDSNEESNNDQSNSTSKEPLPGITVASIKDKYRPAFESLESQANEKINALVSRAFSEYQGKKNNGESISFGYFYKKYSSAGKALEGNTDEVFTYIYSALQADLKKNGFSPTHAKDFKEQYESAKNAREAALLNKAKEAL